MALNPKLADAAVNAEADAVCALLNTGKLRIYDGTQPASADDAIGAQILLAELIFGNPAFGSPSAGVATANAISADTNADATGTATWFRCLKSDLTKVYDGSIATGSPKTITAATAANPAVLTKTAHGLVTGNLIKISGFSGNWVPANGTWRVTYLSADTFSIPVNSGGFGAMTGSPVYQDTDINLNSVAIQINAEVSVTGFTFTAPKS